jgi:hypothetical protein
VKAFGSQGQTERMRELLAVFDTALIDRRGLAAVVSQPLKND